MRPSLAVGVHSSRASYATQRVASDARCRPFGAPRHSKGGLGTSSRWLRGHQEAERCELGRTTGIVAALRFPMPASAVQERIFCLRVELTADS